MSKIMPDRHLCSTGVDVTRVGDVHGQLPIAIQRAAYARHNYVLQNSLTSKQMWVESLNLSLAFGRHSTIGKPHIGQEAVGAAMTGRKIVATVIVFGIAVGGCAGVPKFDIEGAPTIKRIVDQVECELAAARRDVPRLRDRKENWRAVVDLSLIVEDSVGLTPTISVIDPLRAGESFTFGASAALKGARKRIYAEHLEIPILDIVADPCDNPTAKFDLTGDLGIVETVSLGLRQPDPGDAGVFVRAKEAFGETVQFMVTRNVSGVGPTWRLIRFTGPGGLFGAERIDTHKLIISFQAQEVVTQVTRVRVPSPPGFRLGAPRTRVITRTRAVPSTRANELNLKMLLESLPPGALR